MLMSMTGFGRSHVIAPFGQFIVEIQSVNRKYLEIFVSMPKEWTRFENDVRKWIGMAISRGQINVRIYFMPGSEAIGDLLPDLEWLRQWKTGWERLASSLGYDAKTIDFPFLVQSTPLSQNVSPAKEQDVSWLHRGIDEALDGLVQMKQQEGAALSKDLIERLKQMQQFVATIETAAPDATEKMRQKLKEKIQEASSPEGDLDERIFKEVALFAERVDITEEIIRLKSHFVQFQDLVSGQGAREKEGRKMDFLAQEMGREINTIGAKSLDAQIAHLVIAFKSELEKSREQIQNIE